MITQFTWNWITEILGTFYTEQTHHEEQPHGVYMWKKKKVHTQRAKNLRKTIHKKQTRTQFLGFVMKPNLPEPSPVYQSIKPSSLASQANPSLSSSSDPPLHLFTQD